MLIVLLQYVPRLYLIFPLSSQIIKATGVVTKTAWAGAAYNLLLYMLASHVCKISYPNLVCGYHCSHFDWLFGFASCRYWGRRGIYCHSSDMHPVWKLNAEMRLALCDVILVTSIAAHWMMPVAINGKTVLWCLVNVIPIMILVLTMGFSRMRWRRKYSPRASTGSISIVCGGVCRIWGMHASWTFIKHNLDLLWNFLMKQLWFLNFQLLWTEFRYKHIYGGNPVCHTDCYLGFGFVCPFNWKHAGICLKP